MSTKYWCIDKAEPNHWGKDRFEIKGWIWSKKDRNFSVKVYGDKKQEIPYRISWGKRPDVEKYLKLQGNSIDFGFTILIPEISKLWDLYKELEVVFCHNDEIIRVFHEDLSAIKELCIKNRIQYHVDSACIQEDMAFVKGWAFYKKEVCPIQVTDSQGRMIEYGCKREVRPEVNHLFSVNPETKSEFTLEIPKKYLDKGRVQICFRKEEAQKTYVLSKNRLYFDNSRFGKYYHQLGPKKAKENLFFIRNFGMEKFRRQLDMNMNPGNQGYGYWVKKHRADRAELKRQKQEIFACTPLISIVIPLYNTPLKYLHELLESVTGQTYTRWQLCLADGSPNDRIQKFLEQKYKNENRITYKRLEKNGGISENTNEALKLAKGDYIMLSDHDDILECNALYEIVKAINRPEKPDIIYTDEDKVTMDGKEYFDPHFKPDFNWNLLRSNNYICHIFVAAREIIEEIGEFRKEYDGAQDFDFILRCCEKAKHIYHVPKVLYHWRSHPDSTAGNPASKMYAYQNGVKSVAAHYKRIGQEAEVELTPFWGRYRSKLKPSGNPLVSIIIQNQDHIDELDRCLNSVYEKSTYSDFEVLVVETNSSSDKTFAYYVQAEQTKKNLRVLYGKKEFGRAAVYNFGAAHASGEYLLFLDNHTQVITPDWIEEMLGYCQREEVGVVGAKLYSPEDTIEHAGIVLGMGEEQAAGRIFYGVGRKQLTYAGRANSTQDITAVADGCMLVRKSVHKAVGGFDESFVSKFYDVDYCLRVGELGKAIVFHAFTELYYDKSDSERNINAKKENLNRDTELFRKRWKEWLRKGDAYYNPNLNLKDTDCTLKWE